VVGFPTQHFSYPPTSFCLLIYPLIVQEIKELEPEEVGGFILVHGRSLTDILREYVRYGTILRTDMIRMDPHHFGNLDLDPHQSGK
jgi:hypothetical protein